MVSSPPEIFLDEFDDIAEQDITQARFSAADACSNVSTDGQ